MLGFLILATCMFALARWTRRHGPAAELSVALNWWLVSIAFPALVLERMPTLKFDFALWFLVASQWLMFGAAFAVFRWLGKMLGWSNGRIGALTLVCGLGNTGLLGYPMLEAFRGTAGMALGVVADQFGTFLALSLGSVVVTAVYAGGRMSAPMIVRRVVLFPPFIAVMVGVMAGSLGGWPAPVVPVLHVIGQTLAPLALFGVSLNLSMAVPAGDRLAVALGLGWKLVLAPLAVLGFGAALGLHGLIYQVGVLQSAMAPMLTGAIIANQYRLDPELANASLGSGMVLSFLTVPLWNLWLGP